LQELQTCDIILVDKKTTTNYFNNMSDTNTTPTTKEEKTQTIVKKSNTKKWWIGALALVLVLSISGAVYNTLNQKTSTSKADSAINVPKPTPTKPCLRAKVEIPCPTPSRRPVPKQ
jgi:uncharacterized protein HemX